jgi:hypothetical protein
VATCSRETGGASAFGWLPSMRPYAQLQHAERCTWTRTASWQCEPDGGHRAATAGCSGSTRGAGEHAARPQPTRRRSARSASSIAWRVVDVIGRITRDTRNFEALTEPLHLQETVGVYDRRIHAAAAVCTQFCARRHAACVGCAERNTMALRRGSGVCALREEEADGVAAVCAGPARQTRQSLEPRVHAMHIAEL